MVFEAKKYVPVYCLDPDEVSQILLKDMACMHKVTAVNRCTSKSMYKNIVVILSVVLRDRESIKIMTILKHNFNFI